MDRDPGRDLDHNEVIEEVARILSDARDLLLSVQSVGAAIAGACQAATYRSIERLERGEYGPESLAELLASWLVQRADRPTPEESLAAAQRAVAAAPANDPLAQDLHEFVREYISGAMSDQAFQRRLRKPRGGVGAPKPAPPGRTAVDQAVVVLRRMLAEARVDLGAAQLADVWPVFRAFLGVRVGVAADDEEVFAQWGVYDWSDGGGERFELDFTRQFSVIDADGDYDHMEQLRCTFYFLPEPDLKALGSGDVWAGHDRDAWAAEVETLPVFEAAALRKPAELRIEQEHV